MPECLVLDAPAKLNLTLDITGLLPNGYHALDMVMQTISLCDTLTIQDADEIEIVCPDWLEAGPKNLAWRAAEALRAHAGVDRGVRVALEKRIPVEAGLGGGSADAAAVLKGLNELWELGLSVDELCRVGLKLGSDVPFAIAGGTARVRGIGENIEPIGGAKPLWFLLAKPAGGVSTAEAYRRYDETGACARPDTERFIDALICSDIEGMARFGGNALERVAVKLLPPIGGLLADMKVTGTGYCSMTGSGAAVFGVFASEAEARSAQALLIQAPWTEVACSVSASGF